MEVTVSSYVVGNDSDIARIEELAKNQSGTQFVQKEDKVIRVISTSDFSSSIGDKLSSSPGILYALSITGMTCFR